MKEIFEQTSINGLVLRNRLIRSATWEGMCDKEGRPTAKLADCYEGLSSGGIGLIVTGYAFVREEGKQLPGKMGMHRDDFAEDMINLTSRVHNAGGKIVVQLVHAGGQADARVSGRTPLAPSAVEAAQFPEKPEAMTKQDIKEVAAAFGEAAKRARNWGFDGIQMHGAHGYLINQFLSPLTNCRTDEYGGSLQNRCRFLIEVYESIRNEVGDDYPVMIKLNGADNLAGGLQMDDAVYAAKLLDGKGIDAIEVSAGTPASSEEESPVRTKIDNPSKEAFNLGVAQRIKAEVRCPVMVVGGFRSYDVAVQALDKYDMDYISLARPLIREPDLAARWGAGDKSPATCISCNGCFRPGLKEGGIYCVVEKKEKEKRQKKT